MVGFFFIFFCNVLIIYIYDFTFLMVKIRVLRRGYRILLEIVLFGRLVIVDLGRRIVWYMRIIMRISIYVMILVIFYFLCVVFSICMFFI